MLAAEILALVSLVVTSVMVVYVLRAKRQIKQTEAYLTGLVDELSKEVRALGNSSMGIGRKALSIEDRLDALKSQFEVMQKNDPINISYAEAMRLVSLGAGVEDLMDSCGISRPEAELVTALSQHRQDDVPILHEAVTV